MTSPANRTLTIVLAAAVLLALLPQASAANAQGSMEAPVLGAVPEGLSVVPIAGEIIDAQPPGPGWGLGFRLEHIPLDPGERVRGRDTELAEIELGPGSSPYVRGHHLIYVESGTIGLSTPNEERMLQQHDQTFLPEPETDDAMAWTQAAYELRNDTAECASVLRVSAVFVGGGISSSASTEGPNLPIDCGEPEVLLYGGGPVPEDAPPMLLFIAELAWPDIVYPPSGLYSHPGAVSILVRSGTLQVADAACCLRVETYLEAGSSVEIPAGLPYAAENGHRNYLDVPPARALMVGAIPAGQELFVPYEEPAASIDPFGLLIARTEEGDPR